MIQVTCKYCNKLFLTQPCWIKRGRGLFCSKSCSASFRINTNNYLNVSREKAITENNITIGRKPVFVTKICMNCNSSFNVKKSNPHLTCSIKCRKELRKTQLASAYLNVDSSKISGENHYNWKGDLVNENKRVRDSPEYKNWRRNVLKRDHYTCQICGSKNSRGNKIVFHADHIKSFSRYPELRLELSNGRTLCVDCHKKTPSWGTNNR